MTDLSGKVRMVGVGVEKVVVSLTSSGRESGRIGVSAAPIASGFGPFLPSWPQVKYHLWC